MNLHLLRISSGKESTLGQLYLDGNPECFVLEDQFQKEKVKHETRIPDGRYEVGLNQVVTPMTERYRAKFAWFTYHLHIKNVKGFENIYIHLGNTDEDTSGCLLLGDSLTNNQYKVGNIEEGKGFLGNSTQAFERVYKKAFTAIKSGVKVTIDIYTYRF